MVPHDEVDPDVLAECPVFSALDPIDRNLIGFVMESHRVAAGAALFQKGDMGTYLAVVADGRLEVQLSHGDEAYVEHLQVIGEMSALDPEPRSASVRATVDTVVWTLDSEMLGMLRLSYPKAYTEIVRTIGTRVGGRLRRTNELIETRYPEPPHILGGEMTEEPRQVRRMRVDESTDLASIDCLSSFSTEELRELRTISAILEYPAEAVICRTGDAGTSCFVVLSGEVEVRRSINGRPCILGAVNSGGLLGQTALVDGGPRSASLVTRIPTRILEISASGFERSRLECSPFALQFQELVTITGIRQLRMANERLAQIPDFKTGMHAAIKGPQVAQEAFDLHDYGAVEFDVSVPRDSATGPPGFSVSEESTQTEAVGFQVEDTVRTFLKSALVESGISLDEIDGIEFGSIQQDDSGTD
jgi:CRP/FNR family transcriptional regulator, cyclic AMP receptor protein